MVNQLDLDIHNQLVRYLAGEIPLTAFHDWFDQETWDVDLQGNTLASELAAEIELRLAEFSSGHRDEDDLRRILHPLVRTFTTSGTCITGTNAIDFTLGSATAPGSCVDIRVASVSW
jgi:hypothetical protein